VTVDGCQPIWCERVCEFSVYMCVRTHTCMSSDALMGVSWHTHVWGMSVCVCEAWVLCVVSYSCASWCNTFTCVPWSMHACSMTHSYVRVACRISIYVITLSRVPRLILDESWLLHVYRDAFTHESWRIHTCAMTHSTPVSWLLHVCYDAFTHVSKLILRVSWLIL